MVILLLAGSIYAQKKPVLTEEQQIRFDEHFINASKFYTINQYDDGLTEIKRALQINPYNDAAYYLAGKLFMAKNMFTDAEFVTLKAYQFNPLNEWYAKQLIDIYTQLKQWNKAGEVALKKIRNHPAVLDDYFSTTYLLISAKNFKRAIQILDEAEKKFGIHPDITKQKQSIYFALNKPEKGLKETEKLVAAFPNNMQYLGMLADIHLQMGKEEKADEIYRKILSIEPDNGYALLSLADDFRNKKDYKNWFEYTLRAVRSANFDVKPKLKVIVEFFSMQQVGEQKNEQLQQLTSALTLVHPNEAMAWMLDGDIKMQLGNFNEAYPSFKKVTLIEPDNYTAWRQMVMCNNETKNLSQMLADCDEAMGLFPAEILFYVYYTFAANQLKEYDKCIRAAESGLIAAEGQDEVRIQFLLMIADAAHALNRHDLSDSSFKAILTIQPEHATALNNFAYYLSLRKEKLDEAAEMSKRSLKLEPENPSFLDTYGYILFLKQEYEMAITYFQKAIERDASSAEVHEHLGDAFQKAGKIKEAREAWQRALSINPSSESLATKLKK